MQRLYCTYVPVLIIPIVLSLVSTFTVTNSNLPSLQSRFIVRVLSVCFLSGLSNVRVFQCEETSEKNQSPYCTGIDSELDRWRQRTEQQQFLMPDYICMIMCRSCCQ
ncbi:hypothetical protein ATANTOWER_020942 [Ataeniobius toweri]|uniref:Secreted protein n=1 Tax=Ataeniobius toweri TaxID=208326 RepID=A0ABU7BNC4_9TELE|nr:hypothetical protein [Ataeniobius toweri]